MRERGLVRRAFVPGAGLGGVVELEGVDLRRLPAARLEDMRGNRIAMIFQEPMSSLNPVFTIGDQVAEAAFVHLGLSRAAARAKAARG